MKYIKKLSGRLCYLSPMSTSDYSVYTEWLNDIETTRYLSLVSKNITHDSEKEALGELSKGHTYAIIDQQTDMLIGNCGLVSWDQLHGTAEVGIFIGNPDYRDKGVGSEAMQLLCAYAFDYLNIKSLFLQVFSFNERAYHSYEKVGFKRIGLWRKSLEQRGERFDTIFMDCLPEDLIRLT
jgi:RimJ/RimL family protein N-acetyltransferase